MNKLLVICGLVLGLNGTAQPQDDDVPLGQQVEYTEKGITRALPYAINEIVFIEEDEVELGFDTATYLPKDFNPYASEYENIEYIEEDEIELGFDTKAYLPANFNSCATKKKAKKKIIEPAI